MNIEYAWLMMFHDIGRNIHTHLLRHHERADFAAKTIARLAADTEVSRRALYEWLQFYRCFPIVRARAQLTRTHYRLLCQVADEKQRHALTVQATKKKWTSRELEEQVRALNAAIDIASNVKTPNVTSDAGLSRQLLVPKRGVVGVYRIVARKRGLAVDVGFKEYLPLTAAQAREFASGDIVRADGGRLAMVETAKSADLFTYRALDYRVVDGDTLTLDIELPRSEMVEKFRLRGIDCPEMNTAEGKAVKRFVDRLISDAGKSRSSPRRSTNTTASWRTCISGLTPAKRCSSTTPSWKTGMPAGWTVPIRMTGPRDGHESIGSDPRKTWLRLR